MPEKSRRSRRHRQQTNGRVLQARIPEHLDDELRDRAEKLGMSVSTLVRNVLLHTFDLVEGVVTDSSQIARVLRGREALPADPDAETAVIGWQEAVLNRNGVCEQCNVILPAGERAAIGVPTTARANLLCLECLGALYASAQNPAKSPAPKKKPKSHSKTAPAGNGKSAR